MLSRLADHPLNYKEEEFIMKYRQEKLRMGTVQKKSVSLNLICFFLKIYPSLLANFITVIQ